MGDRLSQRTYRGKVPEAVFDEITNAVQGDNPERDVESILGRHRRKSYYTAAVEEAKVMLTLRGLGSIEDLQLQ
jgi:hypothetical protein